MLFQFQIWKTKMKASFKFREEQKPLLRAKVPLSIVGLPFQSGIVIGESKDLCLNLATFFQYGPSIKISYRPNDTWNPFSLLVKSGTGPFGSPVSSSMLMSAEFNLIGKGNPSFMLHFKPQFGDFSFKKSMSSLAFEKTANGAFSSCDDGVEVVETPVVDGSSCYGKRITVLLQPTANAIAGVFSGVEVAVTTKLPVRSRAVMNFRWGVRVPAEITSDSTAGINFRKIPFLVMNKIGIEHCDDLRSKEVAAKVGGDLGEADLAGTFFTVKRQLEVLQAENGLLKKAVNDIRQEIAAGKSILPVADLNSRNYREIERDGFRNGSGTKLDRRSNDKKSMECDVNEELKKALKGATGGTGS